MNRERQRGMDCMKKSRSRYFDMEHPRWKKVRWFLSREIIIEYKACLYFCCLLFFYFAYLAQRGQFQASVAVMCEMVVTAYAVGYLQVYALWNFDDAEHLDAGNLAGAVLCTGIYTAASLVFCWFGRGRLATALFAAYLLAVYFCVFLINNVKRGMETEALNRMLGDFKAGQKEEETEDERKRSGD